MLINREAVYGKRKLFQTWLL